MKAMHKKKSVNPTPILLKAENRSVVDRKPVQEEYKPKRRVLTERNLYSLKPAPPPSKKRCLKQKPIEQRYCRQKPGSIKEKPLTEDQINFPNRPGPKHKKGQRIGEQSHSLLQCLKAAGIEFFQPVQTGE